LVSTPPPSEPDVRISRIRLVSVAESSLLCCGGLRHLPLLPTPPLRRICTSLDRTRSRAPGGRDKPGYDGVEKRFDIAEVYCKRVSALARGATQYRAFPGVRGNGIASRTFASPVTYASVRSNPSPNPAWGTVP